MRLDLAQDVGYLLVWVTKKLLKKVLLMVERAWGYTFVDLVTWVKLDKNGKPTNQLIGYIVRHGSEILLIMRKGNS